MAQKKENGKPTVEESISYNSLILKNQELEIKINRLSNEMLQFQEQLLILNSNMHGLENYLTIAANNSLEDGQEVTATGIPPVKEQ